MNKRTDAIRAMFAGGGLSADNSPIAARSSSGSVRSVRDTFAQVERENEELRSRLIDDSTVDLDPQLIDPSPLSDRFEDQDKASFSALRSSIAEQGQLIPVLVRPHPSEPGRYQSAYGHRRIRAARDLGVKVIAQVRSLSEEELAVAQGVENSAREDLSFIERAFFALRLEDAGLKRTVVQTALAIDKAEVSKLVAVARSVPPDIVAAIGRAPKVGRSRWQALAQSLKSVDAEKRARRTVASDFFSEMPSNERFAALAKATSARRNSNNEDSAGVIAARDGKTFGRYKLRGETLTLNIDKSTGEFLAFLVEKFPDLLEGYQASNKSG